MNTRCKTVACKMMTVFITLIFLFNSLLLGDQLTNVLTPDNSGLRRCKQETAAQTPRLLTSFNTSKRESQSLAYNTTFLAT